MAARISGHEVIVYALTLSGGSTGYLGRTLIVQFNNALTLIFQSMLVVNVNQNGKLIEVIFCALKSQMRGRVDRS
jgi:hypothetical protein